jgi:hypothetical protein
MDCISDDALFLIWKMLPLSDQLSLAGTSRRTECRCAVFMALACRGRLTRWASREYPRLSYILNHHIRASLAKGIKQSKRTRAQKAILAFLCSDRQIATIRSHQRETSHQLAKLSAVIPNVEFQQPSDFQEMLPCRIHRYCKINADFRHIWSTMKDCYLCNPPRSWSKPPSRYEESLHVDYRVKYDVVLKKSG